MIKVYEGERKFAKDNHYLDQLELAELPSDCIKIRVIFDLDANGILTVTALDQQSGKSSKLTITNEKGRLSKDSIERMILETERFAHQDAQKIIEFERTGDFESLGTKQNVTLIFTQLFHFDYNTHLLE